jgi:beta-N-acetylhexosaminidase
LERSTVVKLLAPAILGGLIAASPVAATPSLETMAGQMILVGFGGDSASDKSVDAVAGEIGNGVIGGVIFLKPNVASLEAVKQINAKLLAAAREGGLPPPFLALDQEGGAVERLTRAVGFAETPSAAAVAKQMDADKARALYEGLAQRLGGLGFNLNFGPVADVNVNPDNPIIGKYGRAFSNDAWTVFQYDAAFIEAHHDNGLLTSLKHFPGHGSSTGDSHEGFVDITKSWNESELAPYKYLLRAHVVDMVMVGHLYNGNAAEDGAKLPASLSSYWINTELRDRLKFDGVVISDDLEMGAIRKLYSLHDTVVKAVTAGVDILLFSNTAKYSPELGATVRKILVDEANADPAFRARIEQSYNRIAALKGRLPG